MRTKAAIALLAAACFFSPLAAFADTASSTSYESQVRSYFSDIPVMQAIAQCESSFRQFGSDGTVLKGGDGTMEGLFQLSANDHSSVASGMGFDITTAAGNMAYARYLYGQLGTSPWMASFGCWGDAANTSATSSAATDGSGQLLTLDMALGAIDPQVLALQQILNRIGYAITSSGPGSPGQETDKFGALTLAAVKKFQCSQGIVCAGDAYTTGYGVVNAATRAKLLSANAAVSQQTIAANGAASLPPPAATSTATTSDQQAALIAQLQSQIIALVAVLNQLKQQLGIQ